VRARPAHVIDRYFAVLQVSGGADAPHAAGADNA
jgi:hypothetical protein